MTSKISFSRDSLGSPGLGCWDQPLHDLSVVDGGSEQERTSGAAQGVFSGSFNQLLYPKRSDGDKGKSSSLIFKPIQKGSNLPNSPIRPKLQQLTSKRKRTKVSIACIRCSEAATRCNKDRPCTNCVRELGQDAAKEECVNIKHKQPRGSKKSTESAFISEYLDETGNKRKRLTDTRSNYCVNSKLVPFQEDDPSYEGRFLDLLRDRWKGLNNDQLKELLLMNISDKSKGWTWAKTIWLRERLKECGHIIDVSDFDQSSDQDRLRDCLLQYVNGLNLSDFWGLIPDLTLEILSDELEKLLGKQAVLQKN